MALRATRQVWRALPGGITQSGPALSVRRAAVTALTGYPPEEPKVIRTLGELDETIHRLEEAARISDDELRRGFKSFRMEIGLSMPPDPFSTAYRQAVLDLYEWLHGSPYSPTNEITPLDSASALERPFPFLTGSPTTAGDYLMAVGHLIRTIGLGPGRRVLEMGPGWGNVAIPLAQLGCDVTAVEICPEFVELVVARAAQVGAEVDVRLSDFSAIEEMEGLDGRFDAVVFFESFHHSADHNQLLSALDRLVVPGGRIIFGAEPIAPRFWQPWGLRLDGESLWAIRRNGWLELGFRRNYFSEALRRAGWRSDFVSSTSHNPWGQVWVATRR